MGLSAAPVVLLILSSVARDECKKLKHELNTASGSSPESDLKCLEDEARRILQSVVENKSALPASLKLPSHATEYRQTGNDENKRTLVSEKRDYQIVAACRDVRADYLSLVPKEWHEAVRRKLDSSSSS